MVNNERNVNCELGYDRTLSIATMTFNGGNGAADDSLSNYKVIRVGDIAFEGHTNKVHAYGRFVLNDAGDGLMSPRFSCLRPIVEQRYSFWKYYIPREESMRPILVNATKNGTMMNELVPDDLMHESILVPCLAEQEVIGNSFSQLDHVITLHQRECGKPPFNQSPAWEQRKWSEYVSISTDMVDPRSGNYDNLPHVGPGNMESFTGRLYDNVNTVKDDALISGKFHFNPGDIIYGKINPQLGKYTYAQFEGLASADAYVLNGKNGLTQEFLFGILQTKAFFDYSVSVSMRSGMPKINRDELNAFEFLAPNESEQRAIGDILLKLDDLITLHQRMCPIFSFCAHGSRTNFAQTLQGWLQILRYPRPIPKMLVSPSAPASGVFGTAKGAFICASSSAGASTSSPSARKNFITSSTLCCRESLSSP